MRPSASSPTSSAASDPFSANAQRVPPGLLAECRARFRERGQALLCSVREALDEDIQERLLRTTDPEQVQLLGTLQREFDAIGSRFEQIFATTLDEVANRLAQKTRKESLYGRDTETPIELSLIDDQEFSEALTIKGQATLLQRTIEEQLKDLLPRIALLLGCDEIDANANPLGPEVISEALKEACWALDCAREAKVLLFELATRKLAPILKPLYEDLNTQLIENGVLPRVKPGVRRGGVKPDKTDPSNKSAELPEDEEEAADLLRQLFTRRASQGAVPAAGSGGGRIGNGGGGNNLGALFGSTGGTGGGGGSGGGGASGPIGIGPEVLQVLSQLQRGAGEATLGEQRFVVNPEALANVNVLHELREAGLARHVGSVEGIVIDVVATLFDFIFDDSRVPKVMKGLIGRLQLPVLKLALVDHSFFSNRRHPARQLISTMAQAATTWDGELSTDSSLYRGTEPIVLSIQNEAGEDAEIFKACLENFQAFLAEQESHADQKAAALIDRLTQRERSEISHSVAWGAVARHLEDLGLPAEVRGFLANTWVLVLARAMEHGGEEGAVWQDAMQTLDALLWSLRPKKDLAERRQLVQRIPPLLQGLRRGMEQCAIDPATCDAFFSKLVALHAEAVKSGMNAHPREASAGDPAAEANESSEAGASNATQEFAIPEKFLPPWSQAQEAGEVDLLEGLERGTWVELRLESGELRPVRLTWVSPARTLYLFANRQGKRALALPQRELAAKLRAGEARVIDEEPFLDRIVADVLEEYAESEEPHSAA